MDFGGFFYVPTGHYENKKILNVHRIHYLLGKYDAKFLLHEALNIIDSSMLDESRIEEFDKEIYKDQKQSVHVFQFKRLFNYYVCNEYRTQILDQLMENTIK